MTKELMPVLEKAFSPFFAKKKRWRSGFNSIEAMQRAAKKGNPHAINILKA